LAPRETGSYPVYPVNPVKTFFLFLLFQCPFYHAPLSNKDIQDFQDDFRFFES